MRQRKQRKQRSKVGAELNGQRRQRHSKGCRLNMAKKAKEAKGEAMVAEFGRGDNTGASEGARGEWLKAEANACRMPQESQRLRPTELAAQPRSRLLRPRAIPLLSRRREGIAGGIGEAARARTATCVWAARLRAVLHASNALKRVQMKIAMKDV
ncbi:hypothetical protein Tco_1346737 [Tanacetum coccineum]